VAPFEKMFPRFSFGSLILKISDHAGIMALMDIQKTP
jgi:hypothetical protein